MCKRQLVYIRWKPAAGLHAVNHPAFCSYNQRNGLTACPVFWTLYNCNFKAHFGDILLNLVKKMITREHIDNYLLQQKADTSWQLSLRHSHRTYAANLQQAAWCILPLLKITCVTWCTRFFYAIAKSRDSFVVCLSSSVWLNPISKGKHFTRCCRGNHHLLFVQASDIRVHQYIDMDSFESLILPLSSFAPF